MLKIIDRVVGVDEELWLARLKWSLLLSECNYQYKVLVCLVN